MNTMQLAMLEAIPVDTRFPKHTVRSAVNVSMHDTSKVVNQILIPIRMVHGRKVKAAQITRRIKHINLDGSVVDEYGELWKARKLNGSSNLYEARA